MKLHRICLRIWYGTLILCLVYLFGLLDKSQTWRWNCYYKTCLINKGFLFENDTRTWVLVQEKALDFLMKLLFNDLFENLFHAEGLNLGLYEVLKVWNRTFNKCDPWVWNVVVWLAFGLACWWRTHFRNDLLSSQERAIVKGDIRFWIFTLWPGFMWLLFEGGPASGLGF